jgi:uncharacterized membrane protein
MNKMDWSHSDTPFKVKLILGMMLGGFCLYFAFYVVARHAAFETAGYDLGNFAQAIWSTGRGRLMEMTTVPGSTFRWSFHFDPILLLFVPIYAALPTPSVLTVLQAVMVALGAIPIFWIGRHLLGSQWGGMAYAGIYLMLPSLQAAVAFDFHGVTLAATFLAFALWSLLQKNYRAFALWAALVMSCKEDMPLLVLMMGLYILVIQRRPRAGIITITASLAWFAMANFVIIPAYSPVQDNIHIERYSALGNNMDQVILNIFSHPFKVLAIAFEPPKPLYWITLTMPVAFTSLLDPLLLLLSLPSLAINTLSDNSASYRPDTFHYTAPIVPFIVVSSISGVARLSGWLSKNDDALRSVWRARLMIVVVGASLGYHLMAGYTPLRLDFRWPAPTPRDALAQQMLDEIPPQASVSAGNSLVPHLLNRRYLYTFPNLKDAEYIALDTQASYYPFAHREELCQEARQLVEGTSYGLIYFDDGLLLLQRGTPDQVDVSPANICSQ